ncbi:MAG: hypothetical protein M2R45_02807 [Verrucomicrobia subdivision 3 bacterium]|nr:hypothetical protein [Limisphaerales bacterium]MCS1414359.1 hypothetical protein [Limisphaerales bacterium]
MLTIYLLDKPISEQHWELLTSLASILSNILYAVTLLRVTAARDVPNLDNVPKT